MIVLSLEIGSDAHRLPAVAAVVAPVLARLFPPAQAQQLGQAVREAVANAIQHGNAADPRAAVGITLALAEDELLIQVSDQGEGFVPTSTGLCPAALRRPHGGGLALILAAVTGLDVTCSSGRFLLTLRAALPTPQTDAA
ncbi:ATP-binding protein [Crossiella sp. CA-258035]|uniref:ATP-binding protein n=1 Tax=Crossiella sp. CA-258035 TaxID=2981138 RepID=UPI0024BCABA4|nr:ATP-binding protein [Crossiella sp. CA-258035]WHT15623.1 ATP-binding protein [Crossiella sp. CA-258035]